MLHRARLMQTLRRALTYATLGLMVNICCAAADDAPLACDKTTACEFQLYIENDSVGGGSDRYYTNGIKFGGGMRADPLIERLFQRPARSVLE